MIAIPLRADVLRICTLVALWSFAVVGHAQTPSPLQEWQNSGGLILERMFESEPPEIHAVLGAGMEVQPAYDGSRAYNVRGGPAIDVRYHDVVFVSTGDGIGYNFVHRRGLEAGVSLAYDLGRKERLDFSNLTGIGDKAMSAVPKAFVSWVVSDRFPVVVRSDLRYLLRTGGGMVGDVGVYAPLPGSSERFAAFLGPSLTMASRHYLQDLFGVTSDQSLASGHPIYSVSSIGIGAYGLGLSAFWRISRHYLVNIDGAINRLGHEAADSPLVERPSAHVLTLSLDYHW
jgi:outer membrane scaffolding protein for murein synthesis (MipA/OmpV family)